MPVNLVFCCASGADSYIIILRMETYAQYTTTAVREIIARFVLSDGRRSGTFEERNRPMRAIFSIGSEDTVYHSYRKDKLKSCCKV